MVVRGSLERLTPLMVGADAPGKEILHPVAVTIFGSQPATVRFAVG